MKRNCNFAWIGLCILLGALSAFNLFADPQPQSAQASPMPLLEFKKTLKEYGRAQDTETVVFRRKQAAELKEFRASQKQAGAAWDAKEKDSRHKYFADHKNGPERRDYIQDYKKRRDAYILSQSELEKAHRHELDVQMDVLRQKQSKRLKEFHEYLDKGVRPPVELWP